VLTGWWLPLWQVFCRGGLVWFGAARAGVGAVSGAEQAKLRASAPGREAGSLSEDEEGARLSIGLRCPFFFKKMLFDPAFLRSPGFFFSYKKLFAVGTHQFSCAYQVYGNWQTCGLLLLLLL
jgi:hypothetical protein